MTYIELIICIDKIDLPNLKINKLKYFNSVKVFKYRFEITSSTTAGCLTISGVVTLSVVLTGIDCTTFYIIFKKNCKF